MLEKLISAARARKNSALTGKSALVTGASSGIGLATAVRLADEGCHLKLVARRSERLHELKQSLSELYPDVRIELYPIDLTNETSIETLNKSHAFEVDILINNAGLARGFASVVDSTQDDWNQMFSTNTHAAFLISQHAARYMMSKQQGDIIAISSIAAHDAYENGAVYCATKHALRAFHQALRLESLKKNVRVMMISPGMVETEFSQVRFSGDTARADAVYSGVTPLTAADVAESLIFMLKQPTHVHIDELIIKPQQQGNPWCVHRNG